MENTPYYKKNMHYYEKNTPYYKKMCIIMKKNTPYYEKTCIIIRKYALLQGTGHYYRQIHLYSVRKQFDCTLFLMLKREIFSLKC